jgi:signal transduction histidine kinase
LEVIAIRPPFINDGIITDEETDSPIIRIINKAAENDNLTDFMNNSQSFILSYLQLDCIYVYTYDKKINKLKKCYCCDCKECETYDIPDVFSLDECMTGHKSFSAKGKLTPCSDKDANNKNKQDQRNYLVSFPIVFARQTLGLLLLKPLKLPITSKYKEFIMVLCNQLACFIINQNYSEQIKLEKKLREDAEKLGCLIYKASDSGKLGYIASISHEFRTPLNIIISAVQLILYKYKQNFEHSPEAERFIRYITSIRNNAHRLLKLVNNIIDLIKLDYSYFKLSVRNYNIVNIIEGVTQSVANYIEGKGISIHFSSDVKEKILICDSDIIERVMLNLISNAIKFSNEKTRIDVTIKDLGDILRISIKDTGIGIPQEKFNLIFEKFTQIDDPLSRRCEGSGIGLALVKSLIELHNGKIYVNRSDQYGSEFVIELPVVVMDNSAEFYVAPTNNSDRLQKIAVEFSDIYSLNTADY